MLPLFSVTLARCLVVTRKITGTLDLAEISAFLHTEMILGAELQLFLSFVCLGAAD